MRKLASIQKIEYLFPIEDAEKIEGARVLGWDVVVKKGEFKAGDLIIYFEIDSWVPETIAPFLCKPGKERYFNDVKGERLKTIKLRGQISQGLVLPITPLLNVEDGQIIKDTPECTLRVPIGEGVDLTEILGIQKWEPPIDQSTGTKFQFGRSEGNFPTHLVPKTDEPRIQGLKRELPYIWDFGNRNEYCLEVTEKLDGSSVTIYYDMANDHFGVCSRNLEIKEEDGSQIWGVINRYNLKDSFITVAKTFGRSMALQGEIIGPKIQSNRYKLKECDIYWFSLYDIDYRCYKSWFDVKVVADTLKMNTVPFFCVYQEMPCEDVDGIVELAQDVSILNPIIQREGLVFRKVRRETSSVVYSFKAINNVFLLTYGQ